MLGKENTKEQVIDNQMDYVDDESTIGAKGGLNHEDRSSSEELQCGRSQESPRVTRSSSIGSSSTSTDDEEMFSCISITSDEIKEKMLFFVRVFVKVFEEKYSQISKEVRPDSKILKTGKVVDECTSAVNDTIAPGLFKFILRKVNRFMGLISAKRHKKEKKGAYAAIVSSGDNKREILVKAGLEIFQKFEKKMSRVVDDDTDFWEIAIEKFATDAVYRVINYISANTEELSVNLITKGVIFGKSKDDTLAKQLAHKSAKFFKLKALQSEYKVKDGQSSEIFTTSEFYEKVGIKIIDGDTARCYRLKEHGSTERYDYRLLFDWELEERKGLREHKSNIPNKEEHILNKILRKEYILSGILKKSHGYILDKEEEKGKLANSTLEEVNGKDPAKKKDIEEACKRFENVLISSQKKDEGTFSFNLGYLPTFFIRREMRLEELKKKLGSKNQEIEMSRMVLINGEYGTGKSELARSHGYDKENGTWRNIIWIDAKTPSSLLSSFRNLAKKLEIPTENDMDLNVVRDRGIESIVKDMYQYFRDVRSLFIFDNASNYEEIEKFLPSHFSDFFFGKEKPYVLITSRNKNWEQEIEKIDLNDGFSLGESITFTQRTLGIKNTLQDQYLVELVKALKHLPLALTQATAYIKQEGISISEYLKRYNEALQEPNPDRLEALGVTKELFTTLTLNLDTIKREENIGQPACNILYYMAYLDSNQIDIVEIFLQKKSKKDKQQTLDALDRLHKFSVIELEESIARIHMGIQKTIRVKKEQEETEEETLREIMTSFMNSSVTSISHIISVWSHASKYDRLVNEFIDSIYYGGTILHLLAKDGNEKVIKRILKKVDTNKLSKIVNAIDKMECTPLDCAAMNGHLEIVKCFMEKGSDLDGGNLTPLHWASLCGQLEVVKHFTDNNYWDVDKLSGEDGTPLHYAVISGNIDVVKYLVEKGANVNLQDENEGPLHHAAQEGHLHIVQYLIEKGASINLYDKNGIYPLHYAIQNGFLDIAKCLIRKGANVNLQDKDNKSPLYYANESDRLDIVKYLVKEKAITNLCKKNVMSSLYYGTESDRLDIAEYLIKKKISIILNKSDKASMNFFYCDDLYGRLNNIKSLIMRSTMVDSLNKEGMSSLYLAIIYGRLDLTEQLVRDGADVNEQGREGMRPLHVATACNHLNIIDYLMAKGANINEQNREGLSPLHIAVIHAHLGSVKYLVEKGAGIDLKDKCGVSPLLYALTITIGYPNISFYLIKYSSSLAQGVDAESVFNNLLHNHAPNVICYPEAQLSALDLRVQSHKRHLEIFDEHIPPKKRKLENISATPKENASNAELLQGSQNLPLDISMQFEDLADRMKDMVEKSMNNINSEMPACSFNSIAVESVNNKNLRR